MAEYLLFYLPNKAYTSDVAQCMRTIILKAGIECNKTWQAYLVINWLPYQIFIDIIQLILRSSDQLNNIYTRITIPQRSLYSGLISILVSLDPNDAKVKAVYLIHMQ